MSAIREFTSDDAAVQRSATSPSARAAMATAGFTAAEDANKLPTTA
jgi:hypothetical protein